MLNHKMFCNIKISADLNVPQEDSFMPIVLFRKGLMSRNFYYDCHNFETYFYC